ncbi:MAG: hypothetical protein ACRDZP_04725, partial [Acidimicrobiales bacterium]
DQLGQPDVHLVDAQRLASGGPGAVIAADAEVVGSIVMTGATIGPKTSVEGSIIGPAANVGSRSRLGGCSVVRGRTRVADGSVLDSIRYPDA